MKVISNISSDNFAWFSQVWLIFFIWQLWQGLHWNSLQDNDLGGIYMIKYDFHFGMSASRFPVVALYSFTWHPFKFLYRCKSNRCKFTPVAISDRDSYSGAKNAHCMVSWKRSMAVRFTSLLILTFLFRNRTYTTIKTVYVNAIPSFLSRTWSNVALISRKHPLKNNQFENSPTPFARHYANNINMSGHMWIPLSGTQKRDSQITKKRWNSDIFQWLKISFLFLF